MLRNPDFMQAFLDLVIPPSGDGRMPGAGAIGLATTVAGYVEADSRFGPPIEAGLQAVQQAALEKDPAGLTGLSHEARLEALESQLLTHPGLMPGLARHVYLAYYQHPAVLEGLGEPARPPFPIGYEVEDTDPALLKILEARARGKAEA